MTTIVFDGVTLATDSRTTCDNYIMGSLSKIHTLSDGRLVAMSGAIDLIPSVLKWLEGGKKPKLTEEEGCQGIVIDPETGECLEFTESFRKPYKTNLPWAGGSGRIPALTALAMGMTAEGAVEAACRVDCMSAPPIQAVHIDTQQTHKESFDDGD